MPRPLSPETLVYELASAGDPQISPDGTRIVYALGRIDRATGKPRSQLWQCDLDCGNARQLTQGGTTNGGPRWSPNGSQLAFVSDRAPECGIFVLPADGGEARELTRHRQAISDLAWSPDGRHIAYTTTVDPENPDETPRPDDAPPPVRTTRRLDYKQDNRGYLGDARHQIFVVDVASGERRQVTHEPVDHEVPLWSPDGRTLAAKMPNRNGMCAQLGLIDVATGATTLVGPETGDVDAWAWSPRGDRILFAGDTAQTWQSDFFVYDVAKGDVRRLTDDLACLPDAGFATISPPAPLVWLDDRSVLFHAVRAGASGLYTLDSETGDVAQLADSQAMRGGLSSDAAHRYAAQAHADLAHAGEIALFDRETGESRLVTHVNDELLADAQPASWERFDVERGGERIEAWLLKPPDFDPAKRYPVVLDVHGGPNGYYGYGFNGVQQCLATNGFLVVYSNPRGSGSYGRRFTQQVIRDWGGEDFKDLMAVLDAR